MTVVRGRQIVPRLAVPNMRAVVGGLLVALAAVGLVAAHRASSGPAPRQWLVVGRSVPPGVAIGADDLAYASMDLHPDTAARAIADATDAIGLVALAPLAPGDLLLRSTIGRAGAAPESATRRIGIELEPADALNGELAVGTVVDVIGVADGSAGVDGAGAPGAATAERIVTGAVVASLAGADNASVGRAESVRLTLLVPDDAAVLRLLEARRAGSITLVAGSGETRS